jgi:hypothetical protein
MVFAAILRDAREGRAPQDDVQDSFTGTAQVTFPQAVKVNKGFKLPLAV